MFEVKIEVDGGAREELNAAIRAGMESRTSVEVADKSRTGEDLLVSIDSLGRFFGSLRALQACLGMLAELGGRDHSSESGAARLDSDFAERCDDLRKLGASISVNGDTFEADAPEPAGDPPPAQPTPAT